jgi:hypothetical protein
MLRSWSLWARLVQQLQPHKCTLLPMPPARTLTPGGMQSPPPLALTPEQVMSRDSKGANVLVAISVFELTPMHSA